jgi:hypothetical protein
MHLFLRITRQSLKTSRGYQTDPDVSSACVEQPRFRVCLGLAGVTQVGSFAAVVAASSEGDFLAACMNREAG